LDYLMHLVLGEEAARLVVGSPNGGFKGGVEFDSPGVIQGSYQGTNDVNGGALAVLHSLWQIGFQPFVQAHVGGILLCY
jgi:hypothetical protein